MSSKFLAPSGTYYGMFNVNASGPGMGPPTGSAVTMTAYKNITLDSTFTILSGAPNTGVVIVSGRVPSTALAGDIYSIYGSYVVGATTYYLIPDQFQVVTARPGIDNAPADLQTIKQVSVTASGVTSNIAINPWIGTTGNTQMDALGYVKVATGSGANLLNVDTSGFFKHSVGSGLGQLNLASGGVDVQTIKTYGVTASAGGTQFGTFVGVATGGSFTQTDALGYVKLATGVGANLFNADVSGSIKISVGSGQGQLTYASGGVDVQTIKTYGVTASASGVNIGPYVGVATGVTQWVQTDASGYAKISVGSGAGQFRVTSGTDAGYVMANVELWKASSEASANYYVSPLVHNLITDYGDVPVSVQQVSGHAVASTTATAALTFGTFVGQDGGALSVDSGGRVDIGAIKGVASQGLSGYVGIDWGAIANQTTPVGLDGTTIGTAGYVGVVGTVQSANVTTTLGSADQAILLDIQAHADLIGVTDQRYGNPVLYGGNIQLVQGDDYSLAANDLLTWADNQGVWPQALSTANEIKFTMVPVAIPTAVAASCVCSVTTVPSTSCTPQVVKAPLTSTQTSGLSIGTRYTYDVRAKLLDGETRTLVTGGFVTVLPAITSGF